MRHENYAIKKRKKSTNIHRVNEQFSLTNRGGLSIFLRLAEWLEDILFMNGAMNIGEWMIGNEKRSFAFAKESTETTISRTIFLKK
ncbi:MAG: hypothetical protein ACOY3I_10410 [Verrucomicrobiota bacterium]